MSMIEGAKAMLEGFGENPPPLEVAQARADICTGRLTGKPCPSNHTGAWSITDQVARVIRAQREKKLELKLRTEGEERLGTCRVCRCPLFLKVFYDFETIYGHTSDYEFKQLKDANPSCWMWAEYMRKINP